MAKKEPYRYGKSPAPKSWQEASEVLRDVNESRRKRKKGTLLDRLDRIEENLRKK